MTRFLLCSFAPVLLYPPASICIWSACRVLLRTGASEAQLHIAFSVYLAGMASAMLFAGRIADRSGRKPVATVGAAIFVIASLLCARAYQQPLPHRTLYRGSAPAAATWWLSLSCAIRWTTVAAPRCCRCSTASPALSPSGAGAWPPDYAEISVAEPVLHDDRHGRHGRCAVGLYPA